MPDTSGNGPACTGQTPEAAIVIAAIEQAWHDHHHTRDQNWKALQMEAALGAGLLTVTLKFENPWITSVFAVVMIFMAWLGIRITYHHRVIEQEKLGQILACETTLGLLRAQYFGEAHLSIPRKLKMFDIMRPSQASTSLYMLWMHVTLMAIAMLVAVLSWWPRGQ
jgi:hypothetical protein